MFLETYQEINVNIFNNDISDLNINGLIKFCDNINFIWNCSEYVDNIQTNSCVNMLTNVIGTNTELNIQNGSHFIVYSK